MAIETIIEIIVLAFIALVGIFVIREIRISRNNLNTKEEDAKRKMYEIAILKELGERMGYSLNIQNIIEVITGSLRQLIDYSVASYMLLDPEKIIFKVHLEKSVSRKFMDDVKTKMTDSLSILTNGRFKNIIIEETLSGAILNSELDEPLGSFFNIPLIIAGRVVGVLTVADTRVGIYKEEEIIILYKVAQQAAQAVDRLEKVVELEQSKLNAMVASMTEGVVMTDTDYRVLVVNPAVRKAVDLENEKDLTIFDFIDKLSGKFDFRGKIEESVKFDKVFLSDEVSLSNGFFQIAVSPVKNNGKILGCVVIFRDITHEKEVQQIKEDFTSMIVHELRSPLDSIKKMIEMMRTSEIKKARQLEYLQMMHGSSSDMLELINNLLDIAKIEAGKFELTKLPSDISEIIESRILFFNIAAMDVRVKLTSQLAKNIPDKVEFDPHTISQVLNNLISNALKFNKENGSVVVQAMLHKKGASLEKEAKDSGIEWFIKKDITDLPDSLFVAITNTGPGIAQDQISKLFNNFFQVKTVFAKKAGTGLGLAITKSIIDSHGGVVGVESVEDLGASFYFTLPITKSSVVAAGVIPRKTETKD